MAEKTLARMLCALLLACAGRAFALEAGEALPEVRVEELGEMHIDGEEIRFGPWHSVRLAGKVQVVQYMAARLSAKSVNEAFTDRLRDSGIPLDRYHVTTIVNLDDAMFGTGGVVLSELEKSKKRYFRSSIVADARGVGLKAWRLSPKSSAIIILGPDGRVRFFRDGAMSAAEIDAALALVRDGDSAAVAGL